MAPTPMKPTCELCGEPMPPGEEVFKFHGYSGPCPKPPLPEAACRAAGATTPPLTIAEASAQMPEESREWLKPRDGERSLNFAQRLYQAGYDAGVGAATPALTAAERETIERVEAMLARYGRLSDTAAVQLLYIIDRLTTATAGATTPSPAAPAQQDPRWQELHDAVDALPGPKRKEPTP